MDDPARQPSMPPPPLPAPSTPPRDPHGITPRGSGAAPVNTLGTVAFALSLVGLLALPGVASVPALVCGLLALRREPKALAIVAIVLSAVEILAVAALVVFVFVVTPVMTQAVTSSIGEATTGVAAEIALEAGRGRGKPLADYGSIDEYLPPASMPVDHWGNALRAEFREIASGRCALVWSAGADGVWDSDDDFVAACEPRDAARELALPMVD